MLGVGPDGHVASLFPGYPQLDVDDRVAVAVHDSPKPPPRRISLTMPCLNRSRRSGSWSAATARPTPSQAALATDPDLSVSDLPARRVNGTEDTIWFLDKPAAFHTSSPVGVHVRRLDRCLLGEVGADCTVFPPPRSCG